eukprot:1176247-Prorocentrum_minimum.AAC.1
MTQLKVTSPSVPPWSSWSSKLPLGSMWHSMSYTMLCYACLANLASLCDYRQQSSARGTVPNSSPVEHYCPANRAPTRPHLATAVAFKVRDRCEQRPGFADVGEFTSAPGELTSAPGEFTSARKMSHQVGLRRCVIVTIRHVGSGHAAFFFR